MFPLNYAAGHEPYLGNCLQHHSTDKALMGFVINPAPVPTMTQTCISLDSTDIQSWTTIEEQSKNLTWDST